MQWQSSTDAVVGMHASTTVKGRLQIFLMPGAMLLNLPARNGTRTWKSATDYGVGWRMVDFMTSSASPPRSTRSAARGAARASFIWVVDLHAAE